MSNKKNVIDVQAEAPKTTELAVLNEKKDTQIARNIPTKFGTFDTGTGGAMQAEFISICFLTSKWHTDVMKQGELYLGKDRIKIAGVGGSVDLILVSSMSYWKDWPSAYNTSFKPAIYQTEEEAIKAGHHSKWVNNPDGSSTKPDVAQALTVFGFLKNPNPDDDVLSTHFLIPIGGDYYTPVIIPFERRAYADAAARINLAKKCFAINKTTKDITPVCLGNRFFSLSAPNVIGRTSGLPYPQFRLMMGQMLTETQSADMKNIVNMAITPESVHAAEDL